MFSFKKTYFCYLKNLGTSDYLVYFNSIWTSVDIFLKFFNDSVFLVGSCYFSCLLILFVIIAAHWDYKMLCYCYITLNWVKVGPILASIQ